MPKSALLPGDLKEFTGRADHFLCPSVRQDLLACGLVNNREAGQRHVEASEKERQGHHVTVVELPGECEDAAEPVHEREGESGDERQCSDGYELQRR
jgi:hypothetical protein